MSAAATQGESVLSRLQSFDMNSSVVLLRDVLRNPTAHTGLAIALLAAVVIAVLLLVLFVLMLITPSKRKIVKVRRYVDGTAPPGVDAEAAAAAGGSVVRVEGSPRTPPSKTFLALTGPLAVTLLVLLGLVAFYVGTSSNAYCAKTCHGSSAAAKRALKLEHASCVSCHEEGGFLGGVANISSRARMLVSYTLGNSPRRTDVAVDSRSCMRCHDEVDEELVTSVNGVRMSHQEVIAAGQPCSICHDSAGHTADAFTASMSTCLPCHDSKVASADCDVCHTRTAIVFSSSTRRLGTGKLVYPAVRAANRECSGCHDMAAECDTCHGIQMPHSNGFTAGSHARAAAFGEKARCERCHTRAWCSDSGCHSAFQPNGLTSGHAGDWKVLHKEQEWSGGCVCHSQRGPRKGSMCWLCHDSKTHELLPVKQ